MVVVPVGAGLAAGRYDLSDWHYIHQNRRTYDASPLIFLFGHL